MTARGTFDSLERAAATASSNSAAVGAMAIDGAVGVV